MTRLRNYVLILALTVLAFSLSAAQLPKAFTKEGNPVLYAKLGKLAKDNLAKLDPKLRKDFRGLLQRHDDVLMAYLLAYESDANLAVASPTDVEGNYRQIAELLANKGTTHDPEFFLSYVADQTVSDERIQAYREALLEDGLREILNSAPNELELYRAVSQWCVGRLKFRQTSGRDQSPLDITQKSILGRCEEMQILFVAAARTVGLPSRAASTPWWAHQDNNHAWAEVWLDGAWHYTGDMDAAYFPDQTWFSGLIDKTVLILADGSLPSPRDEVLAQGRYDCVINSIRNYAGDRARSVKFTTVGPDGRPLPHTSIGIMVYNWNSLRPLAFVETDAKGEFSLSAGRGAFYASAYKDGRQALELVPSGEESELECRLVLAEGPLPDQDAMLLYPSNPFQWKQAPAEWNAGVEVAKARWDQLDRSFSASTPDSLAVAFLAAGRGNRAELERFLARNPSPDRAFLAYVSSEDPQYLDPKYLWQATAEQLEALYHHYLDQAGDFSPDELASVIAPTVFYEELSQPWQLKTGRLSLYPVEFRQEGETRLERLRKAMTWLKKRYKIDPNRALKGLLPLDAAVRQKYLSNTQYRILAVNLARANGVPAEFAYLPNLIYVQYEAGNWGYYDLSKRALETDAEDDRAYCAVKVLTTDEYGAPLSAPLEKLKLCRYQEGSFYWLEQAFAETGDGTAKVSVPKGEYYLNLGYRVSDSQTAFQLRHLDLSASDGVTAEFICRQYPRSWGPAGEELLALLAQADTTGYSIVLIGNHDQENSIRTADKLREAGTAFLWLGHAPSADGNGDYRQFPAWSKLVEADQRNRQRTVTLIRKNGVWQSYEGLWDKLPE